MKNLSLSLVTFRHTEVWLLFRCSVKVWRTHQVLGWSSQHHENKRQNSARLSHLVKNLRVDSWCKSSLCKKKKKPAVVSHVLVTCLRLDAGGQTFPICRFQSPKITATLRKFSDLCHILTTSCCQIWTPQGCLVSCLRKNQPGCWRFPQQTIPTWK